MTEEAEIAIRWGVVIGASLVAAVIDVKTRRIPNRLCGPLFAAGLVWAGWQNGTEGLLGAFGSAALMSFVFVILFIFAGGGAGDAKLAAGLGAWLSIKEAGIALVCTCIAGGILGIIVAIYKRHFKIVLANLVRMVYEWMIAILGHAGIKQAIQTTREIEGEKLTVPYGVAIFAGVCVAGVIKLL
jgi:prepilin peptidase CpaA